MKKSYCLIALLIVWAIASAQKPTGRDKLAGRALSGHSGDSKGAAVPLDLSMPVATNGAEASKWTFDDCVSHALATNTDLRRISIDIFLAEQNVKEAKDAWLPKISFTTQQSYVNFPAPVPTQAANAYISTYGLDVSWTVWEGNLRKYKLEATRLGLRQKALAGEDKEKNIKLSVLQGYLNVMYAAEAVSVARLTLEASESQTIGVRKLMQAGRATKEAYSQVESQYARDISALVQTQGELERAKVALKGALQIPFDTPFDITYPELDDTDALAPLPLMADVYSQAAEWLPEIRKNELSRGVFAANVKIARAGYFPKIALSGTGAAGYTTGGRRWISQIGRGLNERIRLKVYVPIFDGNATKRAVAKAKFEALRYDVARDSLYNSLSVTIESLYTEVHNAQAGYVAGLKQLEAASLAAALAADQLGKGKVNALDLLTAHNNLAAARFEVLKCKFIAVLAGKTVRFYATRELKLP